MNRPVQDITQDILLEYRMMVDRAKRAHASYCMAIKELQALCADDDDNFKKRSDVFEKECFFYKERAERLELSRMLKNLLMDYKQKRDPWVSNLFRVRDRRWKREANSV